MALNELDPVLSEELLSAKQTSQQYLQKHRSTLEDLEELGDIMEDMLRRQDEIEVRRCDGSIYGCSNSRASIRQIATIVLAPFTRI